MRDDDPIHQWWWFFTFIFLPHLNQNLIFLYSKINMNTRTGITWFRMIAQKDSCFEHEQSPYVLQSVWKYSCTDTMRNHKHRFQWRWVFTVFFVDQKFDSMLSYQSFNYHGCDLTRSQTCICYLVRTRWNKVGELFSLL